MPIFTIPFPKNNSHNRHDGEVDESGVNKLRFWLKIVNDGVTIAKEVVDLEHSIDNIGPKLVREAIAKTNDLTEPP
ncbi:unnamed protein product [Lupinus luteus]|uniref:Uncharacterized protein n=1 Tax=Lupinus luteus TaxID=3873 RepID=A0AAV1XY84_LUPLU